METKQLQDQHKRYLSGTDINSAFKQGLLYSEQSLRHAINEEEQEGAEYGGTPGRARRPIFEEMVYANPSPVGYENESVAPSRRSSHLPSKKMSDQSLSARKKRRLSSKSSKSSSSSKEGSEQMIISEKAEALKLKLVEDEFQSHYDQRVLYWLFGLIFLSNVFINVDHGSLPGCSNNIKDDLGIGNLEFGTLGSIVYGGLTLGSAVATWVYRFDHWVKPTLVLTLAMNCLTLWVFTLTNSFYFDAFLRFLLGFFQVFAVIYQPVWADTFAKEGKKSTWLTILILASPVGVVFGFSITAVMVRYETWRWSFFIQAFCLIPCFVGMMFVPSKYFEIESTVNFKKKCNQTIERKLFKALNQEALRSESEKDEFAESLGDLAKEQLKDTPLEDDEVALNKLKQGALHKLTKQIKKDQEKQNDESAQKKETFRQQLKSVISNKAFVCLCLSLTGLYFVVTGVQYWTADYFKNILGVDEHTASIYFSITSLSAPVGGVFVGGLLTSSYGGYNSVKAQKLQCFMGLCAVACALPIPFTNDFYKVALLLWGLLFFGGFILPPVTGIMINSVGEYQKSSANSMANLCYNLLGYLPAPQLYGLISDLTGGETSKWSMGFLMYSTIFTIAMLIIGIKEMIRRQSELVNETVVCTTDEEYGLSSSKESVSSTGNLKDDC